MQSVWHMNSSPQMVAMPCESRVQQSLGPHSMLLCYRRGLYHQWAVCTSGPFATVSGMNFSGERETFRVGDIVSHTMYQPVETAYTEMATFVWIRNGIGRAFSYLQILTTPKVSVTSLN